MPIGGNEVGAKPFRPRQSAALSQRHFAVHGLESLYLTPELRIHVSSLLDPESYQVSDRRFCLILIGGPPEIVVDLSEVQRMHVTRLRKT